MKKSLFFLILLVPVLAYSQTRRMANPYNGKTYAVKNQSQSVMPFLQEVERQFRTFDYDNTYRALENAIAHNPNSPEALILRARFRKMTGMESEAYADYQLANRLNPYAANLYGYFGQSGLLSLLALEPEQAIQRLSTYQKLNYYFQIIDKKKIARELSDIEVEQLTEAIQAIEADQMTAASNLLDKVIENNPKSNIAHDLKGVIYLKENNFEAAKKHFNEATYLDPVFAISWYNLGYLELADHNYGSAKKYFDKAIDLQDDLTKAYFDRALTFKAMGDMESALADYDSIIELKGSMYIEALLNRGLTKKMNGDFNGAWMDLNQIIAEYPANAELRKNRGNLNLLFGLRENAVEDYTEAIKLNSNYAEAYYNRALAHFQLYDKVSGCADLEKSIELGYEQAAELQKYFCIY